jgi:rubrerythrin
MTSKERVLAALQCQSKEKGKPMNIYDFAMQMEQDGEAFYREIADRTADVGVKRILTMLADDEVKHYNIVKQMKSGAGALQMAETAILSNAKNVFAQIEGDTFDLEGLQVELYQQAQEIERKSREFYQEKAQEVSVPAYKELLLKIADEEHRHYFLLDHMIEFISRPQNWIEDAEFNHLEAY